MRSVSTLILTLLYGLIIVGIIVLFWHWLTPKFIHFLTTSQIDIIKIATITALATNFLRNICDK